MTTPTGPDEGRWTGGSLESGADPDEPQGSSAEGRTASGDQAVGAEIGIQEGEPTTFEPEEERS
jgi:hypothetical protein